MLNDMSDEWTLLFAYGTLRSGGANHHFLETARFVGKGKTKELYALYVEDIPYAIKHVQAHHLAGEVYEVDAATLENTDELEEHPMVYTREEVPVELNSGEIVTCWLYFFPELKGQLHPTGDFSSV